MTSSHGLSLFLLFLLIISSGMISGSEVAFYSLTPNDDQLLSEDDSKSAKRILKLKEEPRTLLATILISNNFINIAIVILSTYLVENLIGAERLLDWGTALYGTYLSYIGTASTLASAVNFLITVVGVTSILVLFGEIAPKIYANLNNLWFAKMMSGPLSVLKVLLLSLIHI